MNRPRSDSAWAVAGLSLLLCLVVWAVIAWPLPKHFTEGIPYTARMDGPHEVRVMVPGDHLQLLYHFWLAADMLSGETPWFYNLYEFNTGDDSERWEPGSYYAPFSLFFAAIRGVGGDAAGWNATGILSLWLTCFFTGLLARRYTKSRWIAGAAAGVAILFPYPWFALMGGSPTGFAMALVPMTFLGLDLAVRDDRWGGGILAGSAVFLAACADVHVFFFTALAMPAWCLLAFVAREDFRWARPTAYPRLTLALLPAVLGAGLALGVGQFTTNALSGSHIAEGRTLREVALFSPHAAGFFSRVSSGHDNQIYLGVVLCLVLALGLAGLVIRAWRDRTLRRQAVLAVLLAAGLVALLLLALGPHGPFHARPFLAARRFIPPYQMVRQAAKVMCLVPVLMAMAAVFALNGLAITGRIGKVLGILIPLGLGLGMLLEMQGFLRPGISLLDWEQGAYAAVAEDADARDETARLMVVTLWPGDSHYASVYQQYCRLYRLRMINGYRPLINPDYREQVFHRFESVNLGLLDDEQLDQLTGMGIRYLAVHEDVFPEKVSPFPVGHTLANIEANPRLTPLDADGAVHSYRIEDEATEGAKASPGCLFYLPARRWEAERAKREGGDAITDNLASARGYLALSAGQQAFLRPTALMPARRLRYLVRARGCGTLLFNEEIKGREAHETLLEIDEDEWSLFSVDAGGAEGYTEAGLSLACEEGQIDVDVVLMTAGENMQPFFIGSSISIPAACFFHAGYTEPGGQAVVFRTERDPGHVVFFGPKLPLETGRYRVRLDMDAEACDVGPLGRLEIRWSNGEVLAAKDIYAAGDAELAFAQERNLPVFLTFSYRRNDTEVRIREVTLSRLSL